MTKKIHLTLHRSRNKANKSKIHLNAFSETYLLLLYLENLKNNKETFSDHISFSFETEYLNICYFSIKGYVYIV